MSGILIDELVSIYAKPALDEVHPANHDVQITIGDLHGNAMKFIYTLVRHGIITAISTEQYDQLVEIYTKDIDQLTKSDLDKFAAIISAVEINKNAFIRLLGDELCDRGANDYFTLLIIQKLRAAQLNMEITISNHAVEFIDAYETKLKFSPSVLEPRFAASMINLQILIAKKLLKRDEVIALIKGGYKPFLKALSYSLSEDNKTITLFSHAPIDIRAISALAKKLMVKFEDYSAIALAKTIDAINIAYQTHVSNNTVHTLYDRSVMEDGFNVKSFSPLYHPIEFITWNRDLEHLDNAESRKGYQVIYVHGHDSHQSENKNVIVLDNMLGKTSEDYIGQYLALYSNDKQLTPALKLFLGGDLAAEAVSSESIPLLHG